MEVPAPLALRRYLQTPLHEHWFDQRHVPFNGVPLQVFALAGAAFTPLQQQLPSGAAPQYGTAPADVQLLPGGTDELALSRGSASSSAKKGNTADCDILLSVVVASSVGISTPCVCGREAVPKTSPNSVASTTTDACTVSKSLSYRALGLGEYQSVNTSDRRGFHSSPAALDVQHHRKYARQHELKMKGQPLEKTLMRIEWGGGGDPASVSLSFTFLPVAVQFWVFASLAATQSPCRTRGRVLQIARWYGRERASFPTSPSFYLSNLRDGLVGSSSWIPSKGCAQGSRLQQRSAIPVQGGGACRRSQWRDCKRAGRLVLLLARSSK